MDKQKRNLFLHHFINEVRIFISNIKNDKNYIKVNLVKKMMDNNMKKFPIDKIFKIFLFYLVNFLISYLEKHHDTLNDLIENNIDEIDTIIKFKNIIINYQNKNNIKDFLSIILSVDYYIKNLNLKLSHEFSELFVLPEKKYNTFIIKYIFILFYNYIILFCENIGRRLIYEKTKIKIYIIEESLELLHDKKYILLLNEVLKQFENYKNNLIDVNKKERIRKKEKKQEKKKKQHKKINKDEEENKEENEEEIEDDKEETEDEIENEIEDKSNINEKNKKSKIKSNNKKNKSHKVKKSKSSRHKNENLMNTIDQITDEIQNEYDKIHNVENNMNITNEDKNLINDSSDSDEDDSYPTYENAAYYNKNVNEKTEYTESESEK